MKTLDTEALADARALAEHNRSVRRRRQALLKHALLILGAVGMLYPLLWMISSSFKPENRIFNELGLWPGTFDIANYVKGWTALRVSFAVFFGNSFLIAALAVVGNLAACSLTAFAFARLEFRFKRFWFALMLGTLMLPYHVTLVPQYVLFLEPRLGQHHPPPRRPQVPRHRRLLRLPHGPVLPGHPPRARRGGDAWTAAGRSGSTGGSCCR